MYRFFLIALLFLMLSCTKSSTSSSRNNPTYIDITTNNIHSASATDTLNTTLLLYADTVGVGVFGGIASVMEKTFIGTGTHHHIDTISYNPYSPETFKGMELEWKLRNNGGIDSGSLYYPYTPIIPHTTNYLHLDY